MPPARDKAHVDSCPVCQAAFAAGAVAIMVTDRLIAEHERRARLGGAPLASAFGADTEVD